MNALHRDFYCRLLPAKLTSRFLLPISSRQIDESISILNFFPPKRGVEEGLSISLDPINDRTSSTYSTKANNFTDISLIEIITGGGLDIRFSVTYLFFALLYLVFGLTEQRHRSRKLRITSNSEPYWAIHGSGRHQWTADPLSSNRVSKNLPVRFWWYYNMQQHDRC